MPKTGGDENMEVDLNDPQFAFDFRLDPDAFSGPNVQYRFALRLICNESGLNLKKKVML